MKWDQIGRRGFLAQSLGAMACFAINPSPASPTAFGSGSDASSLRLDKLTQATFSNCLGGEFRIHTGSTEPLKVELIRTERLALRARPFYSSVALRQEPFSVLFRGPKELAATQGTYAIEHEAIGKLDVFLVPVGPASEKTYYEAIFA